MLNYYTAKNYKAQAPCEVTSWNTLKTKKSYGWNFTFFIALITCHVSLVYFLFCVISGNSNIATVQKYWVVNFSCSAVEYDSSIVFLPILMTLKLQNVKWLWKTSKIRKQQDLPLEVWKTQDFNNILLQLCNATYNGVYSNFSSIKTRKLTTTTNTLEESTKMSEFIFNFYKKYIWQLIVY